MGSKINSATKNIEHTTVYIAASKHKKITSALLKDLLPKNNQNLQIIPRILSNNSQNFISIAKALHDYGYFQVNWNPGCPFPMVVKKTKGSGLLPYPAKIEKFLSEIIPKIPNKLSIKCRLGFQYNDETLQLMPLFNNYPLEKIIIHPRSGKQMYKGKVDPDSFKKCLDISKYWIIYNGDITDLNKFQDLKNRFPQTKEWMLGRGILYDLFLAEKIKGLKSHSIQKKIILLKNFHDEIFKRYSEILSGSSHLLDKMKAF